MLFWKTGDYIVWCSSWEIFRVKNVQRSPEKLWLVWDNFENIPQLSLHHQDVLNDGFFLADVVELKLSSKHLTQDTWELQVILFNCLTNLWIDQTQNRKTQFYASYEDDNSKHCLCLLKCSNLPIISIFCENKKNSKSDKNNFDVKDILHPLPFYIHRLKLSHEILSFTHTKATNCPDGLLLFIRELFLDGSCSRRIHCCKTLSAKFSLLTFKKE